MGVQDLCGAFLRSPTELKAEAERSLNLGLKLSLSLAADAQRTWFNDYRILRRTYRGKNYRYLVMLKGFTYMINICFLFFSPFIKKIQT